MNSPRPHDLTVAIDIARVVDAHGGRAIVVGGFVRDRLLGRLSKDVDLEVYGVPAAELRALLESIGRVDVVGESFTVYKVKDIDVALPRRESKVGRGHRGFAVTGDPSLSFVEASRRRDFTINAMGWDPLTDELLDPHGGRSDLAARRLRATDLATFADDSLRVLRALQFAARFEYSLDEATAALCRQVPLDDLPAERVWGELEKLLLQAPRPSAGFALAGDLGIVQVLWPEMHALIGCPQEPEWHPEGDVWIHTLMVIDEATKQLDGLSRPERVTIMLGAITHDFGKPMTTADIDGRIRSPNHEARGVEPAKRFLDRLNVHTMDGYDVRRQVLGLVQYHLAPNAWYKSPTPVGDGAFRRLARKLDLELLSRLAHADCRGRAGHFDCSAIDWFIQRARALGVEHRPPVPLLMGRHLIDLGVSPGPSMGQILRAVYERQLDGAVTTLDEALAVARELMEQ
ncbi:MAG: polynucleotide adenylyltransferase [Luteitalea sp.]|nr:polynucleotide adenylyltransferase [Luteitalea sp.]